MRPMISDDDDDDNNNKDDPRILSLQEWQVEIAPDVRTHLSHAYRGLYDGNADAAMAHLDRCLDAAKIPPRTTICRLHSVDRKEEVAEDVRARLRTWMDAGVCPPGTTCSVTEHSVLHDVLCVHCTSPAESLYKSRFPLDAVANKNTVHTTDLPWRKAWPTALPIIIVDRFTAEAVLRGADIYVRGVCVADVGVFTGDVVAVYADLGETALQRGMVLQRYRGFDKTCVFLGVGESQCDRATMFRETKGTAIKMKRTAGPCLPPMNDVSGVMLQNLPSIVVAHALGKGKCILDMCCAPGGKTMHLASLCADAVIVACDKSRNKMVRCRDLFDSLGATNITPLALDTTRCVISEPTNFRSVEEILALATPSTRDGLLVVEGFSPESFDCILLDPPCSALGLRPKLRIVQTAVSELESVVKYQRRFVKSAVELLKPGGFMTYSTCTIHAQENEGMVDHILQTYPEMRLTPIEMPLGQPGLPGLGLDEDACRAVRRFDPSNVEADTMGFFIAKFQKIASSRDVKRPSPVVGT